MRRSSLFIAFGAALVASAAPAQILGGQAGGGVGLGAGVGANVGGIVDGATGTLDRGVGTLDRTVNGALRSDLTVATAADLTSGAEVRDNRGRSVGTLQSVNGGMALVVKGDKAVNVPLASLYRSGKGLVTQLSRSQLRAAASANASAEAGGGVHSNH